MTSDDPFRIRPSQFPKPPERRRGKDWSLLVEQSGRRVLQVVLNFLSNFSSSPIEMEGIIYPTAQHAFLAARTDNPVQKERLSRIKSPFRAKIAASRLPTRAEWPQIERVVLEQVMRLKFRDPTLRQKLASTGDALILLLNDWGDNIDGVCLDQDSGHWWGENRVGLILMAIRDEAQVEAEQAQREEERAQAEADRRRSHYAPSVELREKLVPTILSLIRLPKNVRTHNDSLTRLFPVDLLRFAPWQRAGLDSPEDILSPQKPDALYMHALLRAALRVHDDYEFVRAQQRGRENHNFDRRADAVWRNAPLMTRERARAAFEAMVPHLLDEQGLPEADVERFRQRVQELTNSQWRTLFYNADVYLRAGAYEHARATAASVRQWHELDPTLNGVDVQAIAEVVYDQLYSDGLRVFHGHKDKDLYLAAPTRHDLEANQIEGFMREEVSSIIKRERAVHTQESWVVGRGEQPLEWRMVRPFDAEGLWAFSAKNLDDGTESGAREEGRSQSGGT